MGFKILIILNEENMNEEDNTNNRTYIKISKNIIGLNSTKIYLRKIFYNGVILLELGFSKFYFTLNLYISDSNLKNDIFKLKKNLKIIDFKNNNNNNNNIYNKNNFNENNNFNNNNNNNNNNFNEINIKNEKKKRLLFLGNIII
jgi:hypothetical protein